MVEYMYPGRIIPATNNLSSRTCKNDNCRLCLETLPKKNRRFIFAETFTLQTQLTEVAGIFHLNDRFSSYLCYKCFNKLKRLSKIDFELENKINILKQEKIKIIDELRKNQVHVQNVSSATPVVTEVHTPHKDRKRILLNSPTPRKNNGNTVKSTPIGTTGDKQTAQNEEPVAKKRLAEQLFWPEKAQKIDIPILRKSTCSIMGKDQTGDKKETDHAELHKSDENMELKSNSTDTEMRSMQYAIYTLQPSQTGDAYSENHESSTSSYNTVNVKSEPMTQDHCDLESTENENKMMKSQPYPINIFTNNYKHHENTIIQLQSPELLTENVIKSEPHSQGEISRENLKIENSIMKQEPDCSKTFSSTTKGNEYMTVKQESNSTQEYEHENITIKEEPEDEYPDDRSNTEFMSIKTEPETDERSMTEFTGMSIKTEPETDERSNTEFMSIKTEPETEHSRMRC